MAALELFNTSLFNDANLVSYWRFEGNSNDSKGSNNGVDTSITYNSGNGNFGQGAGLAAASSSKIVIVDISSLKITGNFTILAWMKTSTTGTSKVIFNCEAELVNYAGYALRIDTNNHIDIFSAKNSGTTQGTDYQEALGSTNVCNGAWRFIAFVYNGSNLLGYVDGNQDASVAWTNAPAYQATNYIRIGCKDITGTESSFYDGALDDIAVFSRALTAGEISSHWNGTDGPSNGRSYMSPNTSFWGG